jgi:hypothetical protein
MNIDELTAEVREIQANAWAAYKRGDISLPSALAVISRAEGDLCMAQLEYLFY